MIITVLKSIHDKNLRDKLADLKNGQPDQANYKHDAA